MFWSPANLCIIGGSVVLISWISRRFWLNQNIYKSRLPPGPQGFPLFGNLFDMPVEKEWQTYTKWSHEYGSVCHVNVMGQPIILLNSYESMYDFLVKQSKVTADRLHTLMADEIMGWKFITTFLDYREELQKHRSLFYKYMQVSAVKNYLQLQTEMTIHMLGDLLDSPENFMHHIRRSASATIMKLVYGHQVVTEDDEYISMADDALRWLSVAVTPGAYWVDVFPWLQYIPSWFPGTKWKHNGKAGYDARHRMYHEPFNQTKKTLDGAAVVPNCILSDILCSKEKAEDTEYDEKLIVACLGTMYAGGADTSVGLLQSCVLAFALEPEIVRKAQQELDYVVGPDRLPTFEDRQSLPYIEGILRKSIRWNPVLPLGVYHRINSEEILNGFRIPSGSIIIPNIWAVLHDENIYPEPYKFYPERWLDPDSNLLNMVKAPLHPGRVAFGFGRRICPGRHIAENHLFIAITSMIATFNFDKAADEDGRPIMPHINYRSGLVSDPEPFKCRITP